MHPEGCAPTTMGDPVRVDITDGVRFRRSFGHYGRYFSREAYIFSRDLDKFLTLNNANLFAFSSLNRNFALSLQREYVRRYEQVRNSIPHGMHTSLRSPLLDDAAGRLPLSARSQGAGVPDRVLRRGTPAVDG